MPLPGGVRQSVTRKRNSMRGLSRERCLQVLAVSAWIRAASAEGDGDEFASGFFSEGAAVVVVMCGVLLAIVCIAAAAYAYVVSKRGSYAVTPDMYTYEAPGSMPPGGRR